MNEQHASLPSTFDDGDVYDLVGSDMPYGLDLFEPMLKTLRAKASALNLLPRLHQSDMSDFSLPRRYALVMIPFNAFIHNMTQEAQISCLQRCREHLLPDGPKSYNFQRV